MEMKVQLKKELYLKKMYSPHYTATNLFLIWRKIESSKRKGKNAKDRRDSERQPISDCRL